jgi:hypothetical protein
MIFCSYQMEETTSTDQEGPDTMTTTINPQDAPVQERTKESLLPQIQKLIDLSATPGMNQAEAAAMAERAEMLMFRHNVTMAMLAAYNVNERDITARRVTIGKPYTKEKVTLLCTVAAHMNVATMNFLDARGWRYPVDVELMGFPGDLDQVEQLYTSLLVQANRDMLTAEPTDPREHLASFRSFWLVGFINTVHRRLSRVRFNAAAESDTNDGGTAGGTALVLADRMAVVQRWAGQRYADATLADVKPVYTRGEGEQLGREHGKAVDLGRRIG